MAEVDFTRLWLNPLTDLAAGIGFRLASTGLESDVQTNVTVQEFAAGRVRAISTPRRSNQIPVTLRLDTRAQVAAIEAWAGTVVCARDPKGRKFYAVYIDPKVNERAGLDSATVTLTLQEVTVSEAV